MTDTTLGHPPCLILPLTGLSGNMIYHGYVITLQLWYNKQSNYMSLWYITLDIVHPFFGLQHGFALGTQHYSALRHWLTPRWREIPFAPYRPPLPKMALAPAILHWGAVCPLSRVFWPPILRVMCNLQVSGSISFITIFHPIPPHIPPHTRSILSYSGLHFGHWLAGCFSRLKYVITVM